MTHSIRLVIAAPILAAVLSLSVHAAGPIRWEISSSEQWMAGRGEHVAITREGRITLGPAVTVLHEDAAPALWTAVAGPDGTVYVGTGNDGQVLAIRDGKSRVLWDSDELQVHALAWHGDALLAATSPDGRVYRVSPDGQATVFFDPDETYIWALAVDRDQQVYVATGSKGRVYKVGRTGGSPMVIFDSAATNVTALSVSASGEVLVGTDSPGRLYRVSPGGRPFALLDGPYSQVQAIRPAPDGFTYVLAVSPTATTASSPPAASTSSTPTPVVTTEVTIVSVGDTAISVSPGSGPASTPASTAGAKGAVYRLSSDGLIATYWEASGELPFDLTVAGDGRLLVAADNGVVYALDGDPVRMSRLAQVPARQLTRIVPQGPRFILTGSNPGKVLALAGATASSGTYTSEVKDATTGATWGLLRWDGDTPNGSTLRFSTRSGNTSTPDETWSDWVALRDDDGTQRIDSAPARYLQWKVELGRSTAGAAPALDGVTLTYLPRNQRPRVASLTVHPPGVVFQQPFGTQEPPDLAGFMSTTPAPARDQALAVATPTASGGAVGRRLYQKGFQTFQWEATDVDKDDLRYQIWLRRVGTDEWRLLARDLIGSVYTWDTSLLPDARYLVRLVASDARANPAGSALQAEREAGPITIDNTPPQIQVRDQPAGSSTLTFEVTDASSPLERVDVLLADGKWRSVFPEDGALDGSKERFQVPIGELGEGSVVVRATDSMANLATLEVRTTAPARAPGRR